MHANEVIITENGIIEIFVRGDQTVTSVQAMGEAALRLGAEQRACHGRALVLDNLLEMGNVPADTRRQVAQLVKSADFDKLAMLGSGALMKLGANLILQATSRGNCVKYFDNRDEAVAWLKAL